MKDSSKTNAELIKENSFLKQRIKELEQSESDRKQMEEALKESEERFRSLLQNIPTVAVQSYGPDGTAQYWNQASEQFYGYTAQEAIGRNLVDLIIPPEMRGDVEQAIRQMAETGQPIPASELSLMRKDGSRVVVFSSHAIVQIPGRTQELFCVDIDFTEHKQAEEKLRQQTTAMEASMDGIAILNEAQNYVYVNEAHARIYGYSTSEELIGKSWQVLYDEDELQRFNQHIMPEFSQKGQWQGEARGKKKDGNTFLQEISLTALDNGGLICVARDITSRKQAEEQIKASLREKEESEEKFSKAFQTSPYAITITRAEDGTFVEVNNAFISMTGFTREEALAGSSVGLKLWVNEEDRQCVVAAFNAGRAVVGKEYQFRTKTGKVITGLFSAQTIHLGHRPCILSSINDITSRKQAEEQIKASLREKEVLLQEIQHRVKNNLLTISGILALQLNRIKDDKSKDAFITSMNRVNALTQIHTRLYQSEDFSRIDLKEYIEELVRELARSYGFPQEDVITDVKDTSLDITTAIPAGLIVNELVSNAMKHAFPGEESSEFGVRSRQDNRIIIELRIREDLAVLPDVLLETPNSEPQFFAKQAILSVSDNGIGLPHHIDIRNTKSLGFLLIVQAVEQINGDIKVIRENGTQCIITFSVDQEKTP